MWFIVVWNDGERESSFEDYPAWLTVNELKAGQLVWNGGHKPHGVYDARWVPSDRREQVLQELDVSAEDF